MSTGATLNVENGKTLTDLFHKFIRLTVKTDDRTGRFKKRQPPSEGPPLRLQKPHDASHVPSGSRRSQRVANPPSTAPRPAPRHIKHATTGTHRTETPVTMENISYTHTDNEETDHNLTDHVSGARANALRGTALEDGSEENGGRESANFLSIDRTESIKKACRSRETVKYCGDNRA